MAIQTFPGAWLTGRDHLALVPKYMADQAAKFDQTENDRDPRPGIVDWSEVFVDPGNGNKMNLSLNYDREAARGVDVNYVTDPSGQRLGVFTAHFETVADKLSIHAIAYAEPSEVEPRSNFSRWTGERVSDAATGAELSFRSGPLA